MMITAESLMREIERLNKRLEFEFERGYNRGYIDGHSKGIEKLIEYEKLRTDIRYIVVKPEEYEKFKARIEKEEYK